MLESVSDPVVDLVEALRRRLCRLDFLARHRVRPVDFTRERQLTFPIVMLFLLQKTAKSIQRHLHEFLDELAGGELFEPVTAGAWTHARAKLKHTAFIELNQDCVLPAIYAPARQGELQRWRAHRLLGVDSSIVRLPNQADLRAEFAPRDVTNDRGAVGIHYAEARMSVVEPFEFSSEKLSWPRTQLMILSRSGLEPLAWPARIVPEASPSSAGEIE